jgi:protein-tyrosine phosphatase
MNYPAAFVYPRILVGAGSQLTPTFCQTYRITHVINCAYNEASPAWFRSNFPTKYKCINALDSETANILDWYPEFEKTLHQFLNDGDGVVYVHCQMGINRSAYLAIAYVCKRFHLNLDMIVKNMRTQRPCVCQNKAYMEQVSVFTREYN